MLSLVLPMFFLPDVNWINCKVLRHIAALVLLLVWTKLALVVASHPYLSCDIYLAMLAKVLRTSIPVMFFFSLFIGGFSMAFYLILQEPIPKNSTISFVGVEAPDSHDFTFFNAPITSFFK